MPLSASEGRDWIYQNLARSTAKTIVDVGAGQGTYSILGRHLRLDARWIAVEVFEPYVDRFLLGEKYDDVVIADILDWTPELEDYVILFGDVIEHMERDEAVELLEYHKQFASEIMVSVPIVYSPQDSCFGNDHEAHLYHWNFREMLDVLGEENTESLLGAQVGRYWWRKP